MATNRLAEFSCDQVVLNSEAVTVPDITGLTLSGEASAVKTLWPNSRAIQEQLAGIFNALIEDNNWTIEGFRPPGTTVEAYRFRNAAGDLVDLSTIEFNLGERYAGDPIFASVSWLGNAAAGRFWYDGSPGRARFTLDFVGGGGAGVRERVVPNQRFEVVSPLGITASSDWVSHRTSGFRRSPADYPGITIGGRARTVETGNYALNFAGTAFTRSLDLEIFPPTQFYNDRIVLGGIAGADTTAADYPGITTMGDEQTSSLHIDATGNIFRVPDSPSTTPDVAVVGFDSTGATVSTTAVGTLTFSSGAFELVQNPSDDGDISVNFVDPNPLSVTEEGSAAITDITNITFDNRHFTVVDRSAGNAEIILTASAASGGASVQNVSGSTEAPDPATIIAGGGLSLTVTDEGSITETARIDGLDVTLIGSAGAANINQLNVYSSPAGSGRSYTLPNVMSSGSSPQRIIGDGDFLVLKNASTTSDVTILTSALGVTHTIDGESGNIVLSPGEILTLVYSESGARNGSSGETWVTTHRTIERQNLTITDEDGSPTVTDPANLVFGDGLDLTVDTGTSTATVSLPFTPAPDSVNYTDLNVTLSEPNIGTDDEGTAITISNVESDLDWQVGQLGYSYSGDIATLFTFTVTATDLPAGTLTVNVDSVIRTSDVAHTRYLIFAGAPVGGTVTIPTLSTVVHTTASTVSNNRADVYTVNLVNTTNPIVLPFTTHLNDGDYVVVKAVGESFSLLTSGGTLIDEDSIFRRLEDGDSMTLVYSDKRATGGGWYITSFFRADQPRYYRHRQSSAATEWTIDHTLTYRYPTITVYDNNNRVIIPEEITATSATRITITFPTAISGFATLVG